MSTDDDTTSGAQVIDEENRVDQKLKDRIIDARNRVAEREDAVFVGAPLDDDDSELGYEELVEIWGVSVRQYLKVIEPLLRSDKIEQAGYYYHELPLLEDRLFPPDGETWVIEGGERTKRKIPWSLTYSDQYSTFDLVREYPMFGRGFQPPEPVKVTLTGLKDVIETKQLSAQWRVPLNPEAPFTKEKRIAEPSVVCPISKETLELAVRKADEFLQEAGVGLQVGDPTEEADADYSDIESIDDL